MFEITSPPRRLAIPLGHKLIAALIAIAVAVGLHAWFARNAGPSATVADLSFDTAAARRIDPGLADAPTPAVAIAQSFLTDQAVAALSKSAYLSTSAMNARVGEFRARLELTQPSAHLLRVQFHDPDPAKSAVTANAIANDLVFYQAALFYLQSRAPVFTKLLHRDPRQAVPPLVSGPVRSFTLRFSR
jgi:hypothetical protein